jgi:hypothetical protein
MAAVQFDQSAKDRSQGSNHPRGELKAGCLDHVTQAVGCGLWPLITK